MFNHSFHTYLWRAYYPLGDEPVGGWGLALYRVSGLMAIHFVCSESGLIVTLGSDPRVVQMRNLDRNNVHN